MVNKWFTIKKKKKKVQSIKVKNIILLHVSKMTFKILSNVMRQKLSST